MISYLDLFIIDRYRYSDRAITKKKKMKKNYVRDREREQTMDS